MRVRHQSDFLQRSSTMRASTAAIAAFLSLFCTTPMFGAMPAIGAPAYGGAYAQGDGDDQNSGGNDRRRTPLTGCVTRFQDNRTFDMRTGGRVVTVRLIAGAQRDNRNRDID